MGILRATKQISQNLQQFLNRPDNLSRILEYSSSILELVGVESNLKKIE